MKALKYLYKRIRDFAYNINDIIIALIIVGAAAVIILGRVNVLMDYPKTLEAAAALEATAETEKDGEKLSDIELALGIEPSSSEGTEGAEGSEGADVTAVPGTEGGEGTEGSTGGEGTEGGTEGTEGTGDETQPEQGGEPTEPAEEVLYPFSIYIAYGQPLQEIGKIMADCKLFPSADDFVKYVESKGASTKIQSGTFIVPQDASHDEVIDIITKPGF